MFGKKQEDTESSAGSAAPVPPRASATGGQEQLPAKVRNYQMATVSEEALKTADFNHARDTVIEVLVDRFDFRQLDALPLKQKRERVQPVIENFIHNELHIPLTANQQRLLKDQVLDDLLGFGPLEVLLADPEVSDIMVNGHKQIYIEKAGKIYISDVRFASERHLMNVVQKIVSLVGRRIDESSPMVDARMPDGSRFNAIIPPLALDGALISIRKFKKHKMSLNEYVRYDSMTHAMAKFLQICGAIRLNIIVSGGTGSGKTTLLNAISGHIDPGERIVTIEDAAELMLHQPHVLRLETRPPNIEGTGEINQRQLVKNALRMRPDRIILGEMRGDEVIDVLSAMNTGHDGSMATIHANTPKDCLSRMENLVGMSGINISTSSVRYQISSAVNLIVQLERMRDGRRRIMAIEEVTGMQDGMVTSRTLFGFKPGRMNDEGKLTGTFFSNRVEPNFLARADYYGKSEEMLKCIQSDDVNV